MWGCLLLTAPHAHAFSFLFSDSQGPFTITHPKGYTGTGGHFTISVGILPDSLFASEMLIPTQNVISVWNTLDPTVANLQVLGMPSAFDFESVLLHEMGHALGLEHPNLGTESGFGDSRTEYTRSTRGADGLYDLKAGPDGVFGTFDDLRDDDVNLNWFLEANNNPFTLGAVVDSTTYSVSLSDLPASHTFSANASRQAAAVTLGVPSNTEAVMQQGSFVNEIQRTLGHDDVAGIFYGMSGLDELAGTPDDYTFELVFAGITSSADVLIGFNNAETTFATTDYTAARIGSSNHIALTSTSIFLNSSHQWHFNQTPVPEPSAAILIVAGALLMSGRTARRRTEK